MTMRQLSFNITLKSIEAAKYWRVYMGIGNNASFCGCCQLAFYDAIGGSDVTTPADATTRASASSTLNSGNQAAYAFRDTYTVGWISANPAPQWISYAFDNPIAIVEFGMSNANNGSYAPKNFSLQSSQDSISWKDIIIVTGQTGWGSTVRRFSV